MAYTWDNRVRFVIGHMYDTDNNGFLDAADFEAMALKFTVCEKKGGYDAELHAKNRRIMAELWSEMAELSDYNKDGQVSVEEFMQAVKTICTGKRFDQFPHALKYVIDSKFHAVDINGDGKVSLEEYRLDCVFRSAFQEVKEIDDAYNKVASDQDKAAGGISQARYQELYAQFIGNAEENIPAAYLFGPLAEA